MFIISASGGMFPSEMPQGNEHFPNSRTMEAKLLVFLFKL